MGLSASPLTRHWSGCTARQGTPASTTDRTRSTGWSWRGDCSTARRRHGHDDDPPQSVSRRTTHRPTEESDMTTEQTQVMPQTELLKDAPKNWGKWGDNDEVGSLNYLDAAQVLRGVSAARQGKVFTLQVDVGRKGGDPVWPGRAGAIRTQVVDKGHWLSGRAPNFPGGLEYADDFVSMFLQGSTQYDALGHVWYDDTLWNGYPADSTCGGMSKASVYPIAVRGVVGHGVLLDMARHRRSGEPGGRQVARAAPTAGREGRLQPRAARVRGRPSPPRRSHRCP